MYPKNRLKAQQVRKKTHPDLGVFYHDLSFFPPACVCSQGRAGGLLAPAHACLCRARLPRLPSTALSGMLGRSMRSFANPTWSEKKAAPCTASFATRCLCAV